MPHSMSSSSLDSAAEQRDSYGVTEPRVRHAAGISLDRSGAERPLRGDKATRLSCRRHLSGGAQSRETPAA